MSVSSALPCVALLLLQLWGAHTLPQTPACTAPCLCSTTPLLNCSSSGLSKAPSHIPASTTGLDLSHNALRSLLPLGSGRVSLRGLQSLWVGNNALQSLSMCLGTARKAHCVSWTPDLQLLCAETNQLKRLPRGLGSIKSLQVLQLSHNRVLELGPADLAGCTELREVHLQYNLINNIDPQAFRDLQKLQILDLRYNLLTSISVPAFLSLRNLNALVGISGNRWRCDCNLKTIRRWLGFDSELGNSTWKIECFSPSHHAGKDVLYLEESDLTCPPPVYSKPGLQKEVTVDEGTELLLSCNKVNQDFVQTRWWTPLGQTSNQQVLLISNITEQHAGLYVCVSGIQEEHASMFNLHVRKRPHDTRLRREAQNALDEFIEEETMNKNRNLRAVRQVSQDHFVLAVCLSVIITFIVAFILGVVLRPFLDKLCKKIRNKRNSTSTSTNSRSTFTQPQPYVNEGYSDIDENVQEVRVGSRVTFGGVTEVKDNGGNIPYYVTVEDGKLESSSESITDVDVSYENIPRSEALTNKLETRVEIEDLKSRADSSLETPLREENSKTLDQRHTNAAASKVVEFEPIPDSEDSTELEEISNLVSSNSAQPQELQPSYEVYESIEQSVDSPTITTYDDEAPESTIHGFTTDPFSERLSALKEENVDDLDPDLWNDSGESFSFTDESPRTSSRVAQLAVLDYPIFEKEMSVDEQSDKPSSCNSSESGLNEEEQTEYTVNPEADEKSKAYNDLHKVDQETLFVKENTDTGAYMRQDTITLDPSDIQVTFTRGDSFDDECSDSSNNVSFHDEEPKQYNVHPVYRTSQKTTTILGIDRADASSSSEDEDKQAEDDYYPRRLEIQTETKVNNECVVPIQNPDNVLNIPFDNSSSSTDIEDKTNREGDKKSAKRMSGLSALLFNRSGAEMDKNAVQSSSKTTTKDSGKTGGFFGFSFKKQPVAVQDDSKLNTNEESFFGTIGQSFDRLPKIKKSLLFSVSSESSETESVKPDLRSDHLPENVVSPTNAADFFKLINTSVNKVPRVKRYVQFTQSDPQFSAQSPSTSLKTERVTPEFESITESGRFDSSSEDELSLTSESDHFFGQIGTSIDKVPKVNRYIQFTQTAAQSSPSSNAERVPPNLVMTKIQSGRSDSISEGNLSPTTKGDGFFEQVDITLDKVPKVNRYIQFTQSKPQLSAQSPSTSLNTERVTPETKTESGRLHSTPKNNLSPTSTKDNFFVSIGTSLDVVPKVKRYIQFTESKPQLSARSPSTSLNTKRVTPETKTESGRLHSTSESNLSPTSTKENFFVSIGTSLDVVPKVERYIQFTQSQPQSSVQFQPTSINTEKVTVDLQTQPARYGSSYVDKLSPANKGDNFFELVGLSLDKVPKVNRYVQFTQFKSQPSTQSPIAPVKTEGVTQKLKPQTESGRFHSISGDLSPSSTEENLFVLSSTSLGVVPKVKRYIQFTQSQPQSSVHFQPTSIKTEKVTVELQTQPTKFGSSFVDKLSPATKEDNFFELVGLSLDKVPKVNRYVQFTQSMSQPSTQSPLPPIKTERVTQKLDQQTESRRFNSIHGNLSQGSTEENLFVLISTSLDVVPKVKRYIQFTQSQLSPTTNAESIFEQEGLSLDKVPKVKRYIQFTQSVPKPLILSSSTSLKTQSMRSDSLSEDMFSATSKDADFFGQISTPIFAVPRVKRYIQFTQSEPQSSVYFQPTSLKTERVTAGLETKTQPSGFDSLYVDKFSPMTKGDSFFEQTGVSLEKVPKVNRYIQFIPFDPQLAAQLPSMSLKTESVIPEFETKIQSGRFESDPSQTMGDNFFVLINTSFDKVPKVRRYMQITNSEPQSSLQSSSTSLNTEKVTQTFETLPQSGRFDSLSEDEDSPASTTGNFFGQYLDGVPKVKRYIQFTQSKPQSSTQLPSTSWKTKRVTPELKTKTESERFNSTPENNLSPTSTEDHYFVPSSTTFDGVPKLKRYIQFTHSQPQSSVQFPPTSLNAEKVTPTLLTKTQSLRSEDKLSPTTKGDSFFEQVGTSLDNVPKVKRYVQFTQSEPLSQTHSPYRSSNKTESIIQDSTKLKMNSSSAEELVKVAAGEHGFLNNNHLSFDGIPKVKRYIQFTQSGSQLSAQPSPPYSPRQITTPEFLLKTELQQYSSSSDDDSLPEYSDNSFEETDTYSYEIPKVKRYIEFIQYKTHPLRSLSDNAKPSSNKVHFFEEMQVSLDSIPKAKTSLHFTQSEPANQVLSPKERFTAEGMTSRELFSYSSSPNNDVKTNKQDTVHGQMDTSLDGVPKVKRYMQFSQTKSYPLAVNTQGVTVTERSRAEDDIKSDVFESVNASVNMTPTINRYIKFTQADTPAESSSIKTESVTSEQTGIFVDGGPKVKRYIQFAPSEPLSQIVPPNHHPDKKVPSLVPLKHTRSTNIGDHFFTQTDLSIDQVPKVRRYVQFTQSESYPSTQMPSRFLSTQDVTPVLRTKLERQQRFLSQDELKLTTDDFFEERGASLSGLPKANRYIQFTQSYEDYTSRQIGNINYNPQEQNQMIGDSFEVKMATESTTLDRLPRPKRTLFFSRPDAYRQSDQPFTSTQEISYFPSGDKEALKVLNSSTKTSLSQSDFETRSQSWRASLGTSSSQSLITESIHTLRMPTRSLQLSSQKDISESVTDLNPVPEPRHYPGTNIPLQDVNQTITETPPALKGIENAREYLRDSSEARQRQERRRSLFLQKKKAMDRLTSQSSESQDSDKQGSLSDYEEPVLPYSEHTYHSVSTRRVNVNDSGYEGMSAKSISSLRYKSDKSAHRSDV